MAEGDYTKNEKQDATNAEGESAPQSFKQQDKPQGQTEQLGPFAYRVAPAAGQDGAVIFRGISVEPRIETSDEAELVSYPLLLNGLWGERGLRRTILPTGLTVFTVQRPGSTTVSMRVGVRAGSRDEDDVTSGGSHWLEHGHFLGTARRSGAQIDAEAAGAGAHSNASTGWEAASDGS